MTYRPQPGDPWVDDPKPATTGTKEPQVVDLVAALRSSVEAAKARRAESAGAR